VFSILAITENGFRIELDSPLFLTSLSVGQLLDVRRIVGGIPSFSVQTTQQGEDSYYYDVFFVGPHLSNVDELSATRCSSTLKHYGGMRWSLDVDTTSQGGSLEEQKVTFSASAFVNG